MQVSKDIDSGHAQLSASQVFFFFFAIVNVRASYILIVSLSMDVSVKEMGRDEAIDHQELLDEQDCKQSCDSETKRMVSV